MEIGDFDVGDIVRVRNWDDMVRESFVDADGDIPLGDEYFFGRCRDYCGDEFEITGINLEYGYIGGLVMLEDNDYVLTPRMVELVKKADDYEPDMQMIGFLGEFSDG